MWQNAAWDEWRSRLQSQLDARAQELLPNLPLSQHLRWLRILARQSHPVAEGIAKWLSGMDSREWIVRPGDEWNSIEDYRVIFIAYPEYLGWDPLAMCAMAALWAQDHGDRWAMLAKQLGPLAILGAMQGQYASPALSLYDGSFRRAYGPWLKAWKFREETPHSGDNASLPWAPVPDYAAYSQQLVYGVVPHEVRGQSVSSEVAVLLALGEVPDGERSMMAGLAYKALEGLWMSQAWQGAQ